MKNLGCKKELFALALALVFFEDKPVQILSLS
jgi:hypothetical protein